MKPKAEPILYYVFQDADGRCYHTEQTVNVASRYCGKLIGTVTVDSNNRFQPIHEKIEEPHVPFDPIHWGVRG